MKIYIVRHGQTIWNEEGRMQGSKNSSLTEKGIAEAKKLNSYIRDIKFDRIYTSPLGRTLETMEHVKGDLDIPISRVDELQEMDFGRFEGLVLDQLKEDYPEDMHKLWLDPQAYRNESGENYEELFARVTRGLDKILARAGQEENVLLITHGVIISSILTMVKGKPLGEIWDTPVVRNTSLSILEYQEGGQLELVAENMVEHLE